MTFIFQNNNVIFLLFHFLFLGFADTVVDLGPETMAGKLFNEPFLYFF